MNLFNININIVILFFFRRMQCSFNVPEIVGAFRECHGSYEPTTLTKKSLRYVHHEEPMIREYIQSNCVSERIFQRRICN